MGASRGLNFNLDSPQVRRLIRLALDEDLLLGDPTTDLCFPENALKRANFIAKENLVICGLPLAQLVFDEFGACCTVCSMKAEGSHTKKGDTILEIEAGLKDLLKLERTLLNFLQRMCGIATYTADFVSKATALTVLDTRKTTPGWRVLEKYATKTGGARNHRMALGDMLMVKNNHIDNFPACGGLPALLERLAQTTPAHLTLEVETRNMSELEAALNARVAYVMLDNWPLPDLKQAIEFIAKRSDPPLVEISGGVTLDSLAQFRDAKVQLVSVGALTRLSTMRDISMRIA